MKLSKFILVVISVALVYSLGFSQDAEKKKPEYGWKNEGVANLNFTQNQFDNWAQGGEDSWSWQLDINAKFEYDKEKYNWTNTGKVSYGKTKVGRRWFKKSSR